MAKAKNDPDFVVFRVPKNTKNRLAFQAEQAGKTLSAFCRDAAFSADKIQSGQSGGGGNHQAEILNLLRDNQKMQYIIARLVLRVGAEQLGSADEIMKYFKECQCDAEEKYGEG